jgi:hypothetical protein
MYKKVTSSIIPECSNGGRPEKIAHPSKALACWGRIYIRVCLFVLQNLRNFVPIKQPRKDKEMRGRKWHVLSRFGPFKCENPSFAIKDQ